MQEPRYAGLDPKTSKGRQVLAGLQGNVLKGHGRGYTCLAVVHTQRGLSPAPLRAWLTGLPVTTAAEQLAQATEFRRGATTAPFVGIYLSVAAYRALRVPPAEQPSDPAFRAGMKHASRARLDDPPTTSWDTHFQSKVLAVLLVAHDDTSILADTVHRLLTPLDGNIQVTLEHGHTLRNEYLSSIDHFGFVDGISQPLCLRADVQRWVAAGSWRWDPTADPFTLLLVRDSLASHSYGSYAVYRKLEQDVDGFRAQTGRLADLLGNAGDWTHISPLAVGRFQDGAPLVPVGPPRSGESPEARSVNDFDYREDPTGYLCPLHAHIRRMNPRQDDDVTPHRRIARRGVVYGESLPTDGKPTHGGDRGLHFLAFQQDLTRQFEFLQRFWANDHAAGLDPLIGQHPAHRPPIPQVWLSPPPTDSVRCLVAGTVRLRGGEYLYAPSRDALAALGANS
jgi:Dyp-type peroxidase family